ncbi:MAG: tetratricopeptide repeat protein, partial [Chloroflexota bacterium]
MAKVPLRTYLKEVESAIEEHQIDEAIAHCRHILEIYPKHIDTYKLLGKAYLEAQRYGNAVDIFQRILSSIPDDFVSHVGMSVIREDGSNLDAAFWHMERAFEVQPYNPAIRDELRRLYGKRDGVQPPKARLTPGALARLYAKGGHLQQAISELNATISEEPKRFDLLVLLASAYDKSGEQVQAVNTCRLILQDLPYCLEANRLLAKLLLSSEHEEFRLGCEQRLQELDPYQLNFSTSAENVPAQTVMLEHLDRDVHTPGDEEISSKWASASKIDHQEPDSEESGLPDWLDKLSGGSDFSNDTHEPKEETEIPDWMVDAGWEQPKGDV